MSTPGAKLQALRKRVDLKCQVCGATFTALPRAKYCSSKCKQKAYRERQK